MHARARTAEPRDLEIGTALPAAGIVREVLKHGYCWLPGAAAEDASFWTQLPDLGRVCNQTTVALDPRVRSYICDSAAIPFHTDHPEVDLIVWCCEQQDPEDGAIILVDGRKAIDSLPGRFAELLRRTFLPFTSLGGQTPDDLCPVLRDAGSIFFAPWLEPIGMTSTDGLAAFAAALRKADVTGRNAIRLNRGDVLAVDNRRMLHGRRAIQPQSPRRLRRLWLQLGGAPTQTL